MPANGRWDLIRRFRCYIFRKCRNTLIINPFFNLDHLHISLMSLRFDIWSYFMLQMYRKRYSCSVLSLGRAILTPWLSDIPIVE
jgi:hypothetical protein